MVVVYFPSLSGRVNHSICYLRGSIYVIAGKRYEANHDVVTTTTTSTCEKYIIQDDKWEQICPLNEARHSHGCCSFDNQDQANVFVFYGINYYGNVCHTIEKYDIINNKWSPLMVKNFSLSLQVIAPSAVQMSNRQILIYGGFHKTFDVFSESRIVILNVQDETIENLGGLLVNCGS